MNFYRSLVLIALLVVTFLLSISVIGAQEQLCSTSDDIDTFVVVTNTTNHALNLYWVDYDCVEQDFGVIEPGQTVIQPTYATHPWVLRVSETGVQVGEIFVGESAMPVVHEAVCSLHGDVPTLFTITNTGDAPVAFNWVDYDCNEVKYGVLAPGEIVEVDSFDTHPWVLRNADTGAFVSSTVAESLYVPVAP